MNLRRDFYEPARLNLRPTLLNSIRLRYIGTLDDFDVWVVDGAVIRDNVDVDFALGGNPGRYAYVPDGEVWVEDTGDADDMSLIAKHEVTECLCMLRGLSYDEAHEIASREESEERCWYADY